MSMESRAQEILNISQQYTIYTGFVILFGGIFGHIIDIIVFTSSRSLRQKQAAFYLTAESIVNSLQLIISFSSRIAMNGFNIDLTQRSIVWCKFRQFLGTSLSLLSVSIVCFAAMDQYLSTSYSPFLRQCSTLKLAQRLTACSALIWTSHGFIYLIFMRIESTNGCAPYNDDLNTYIKYIYYLVLTGLLPIVIASIFATLAYINVRRIIRSRMLGIRRKLDRQLTAMIFARVAFLIVTILPYITQRIYIIQVESNQYNPIQKAIVQLVGTIGYSLFYLNYSVSYEVFFSLLFNDYNFYSRDHSIYFSFHQKDFANKLYIYSSKNTGGCTFSQVYVVIE